MEFVSRDTLLIASLSMDFSIWPIELWRNKLAKVGESKIRGLSKKRERVSQKKAKLRIAKKKLAVIGPPVYVGCEQCRESPIRSLLFSTLGVKICESLGCV